ncbi:DUF2188 domain-containing protein [Modicisalibacter radicis]|uniref:DUF2188 domain-containing protein n=1 Tax=Halomonas sp. EAR18 TaxID=2518972 RepID=UPI00109D51E5|nr:DUF2188 domain-containing protein [Halomonas sp. EAR18]
MKLHYHVSKAGEHWQIASEKKPASKTFRTKSDAIAHAQKALKGKNENATLVIHKADGSIGEVRSYHDKNTPRIKEAKIARRLDTDKIKLAIAEALEKKRGE